MKEGYVHENNLILVKSRTKFIFLEINYSYHSK